MKRLIAVLLLSLPAWATTAVTGHVNTLGTTSITSNTFVRFWLRGCGGNQPRVGSVAIIAPTQGGVFFFDFPANSSGDISGTLYSNRDLTGLTDGEIECGGSHTATWYGMQMFYAGKGGPETPILAKDTDSFDISNITPLTTRPVVTAPNGDSTYARLDGGNQPFTGSVTPSGNGVLSLGTSTNRWKLFGSTLDLSGAFTGTTLNLSGGFTGQAISGTTLNLTGAATLGQKITTYNNIATVSNGMVAEYATANQTTQAASIFSTTLYGPVSSNGLYRVSCYIIVTQAASVSSTLPACAVQWTDADNSIIQGLNLTASANGNTTTTFAQGIAVINVKSGTSVAYTAITYASSGGTPMQYAIHLRLEAL